MNMTHFITSADGTQIAYETAGSGQPLILVGGALSSREFDKRSGLVQELAERFQVIYYDRRGRGDSGDTRPYAIEREIEDIDALIDGVGGSAYLYGMSSGGVLALHAANVLHSKVTKLALYEPPLILDTQFRTVPENYSDLLQAANDESNRDKAVSTFMTVALGIPEEYLDFMRQSAPIDPNDGGVQPPTWAEMEAVAHTLIYDAYIMEGLQVGKPLAAKMWQHINMPTLIVTGAESDPFFAHAATTLVDRFENAQHITLANENHNVSPEVLAPVLHNFFI